ncbi:MFS transporter [Micromonospora tarensis]|uniref:MFS transporter n=1 Tax=Micromonospora tarensis TaxID=2806100 RepID=A0ABS1YFT3_9ACTN|nr:MFS transporter [Micromonospora tarensis]MBM0276227.1 MFS transporter [Micromonospora tarensis]
MQARTERGNGALVLLCLAQLTLLLDFSIVNMALPAIESDLGLSATGLQWVVSAYALGFGGMLLLGGRMADLLGRRRIFVVGLLVFGLSSLAAGLASASWLLIATRAAQGIGAGMVAPAVLSLITTTFPEGAERNRALGWFSAASASGFALGVLIGGALTDYVGWQAVFLVNVPIVALAVPFAYRLLADVRSSGPRTGYDLLGAATATAGITVLIYGLTEVPRLGLASGQVLAALGAGVALLVAFVAVEARSSAPLVRLSIFRNRSLTAANVLSVLVPGVMGAVVLVLSLYLQQVKGNDPLVAGLSFLPLGLVVVVAAPVAAMMATRFGVKPVLVVGALIVGVAMLVLSRISPSAGYVGVVLPGLALAGVGFGAFFATSTVAATSDVDDSEQGLASALVNTAQQAGTALGVAVLISLAEHRTTGLGARTAESLAAGFRFALLIAAAVAVAAAIAAAVALPGRVRNSAGPTDEARVGDRANATTD